MVKNGLLMTQILAFMGMEDGGVVILDTHVYQIIRLPEGTGCMHWHFQSSNKYLYI